MIVDVIDEVGQAALLSVLVVAIYISNLLHLLKSSIFYVSLINYII